MAKFDTDHGNGGNADLRIQGDAEIRPDGQSLSDWKLERELFDLIREEGAKRMNKATFWLFMGIVVVVLFFKLSQARNA